MVILSRLACKGDAMLGTRKGRGKEGGEEKGRHDGARKKEGMEGEGEKKERKRMEKRQDSLGNN